MLPEGQSKFCRKCKGLQFLLNFYTKGKRLSSICKNCERDLKRRIYRKKKTRGKKLNRRIIVGEIKFLNPPDIFFISEVLKEFRNE